MTLLRRAPLLAGAYPLLLAAMAGSIMVDQIYFRAIGANVPVELQGSVTSHMADVLLVLTLPVLISGALSVVFAAGRARWLYLASLAVFSMEFLLPALVGAAPGIGTYLQTVAPSLRLLTPLGAIALALMATRELVRPAAPCRQ